MFNQHSVNMIGYDLLIIFFSEKGLLHDPEMHFFEAALGCLIKVKEIDVLERLHELQQLQQPAADGEKAWVSRPSWPECK